MSPDPALVARHLAQLYGSVRVSASLMGAPGPHVPEGPPLTSYRDDPLGFCRDVLGVHLTPDQQAIICALAGNRVKVNSGHSLGKTFLAAVATVWWFYTRPQSVVITTAPKQQHIETVLWAEIRLLIARARRPLPNYLAPRAPKLYDHPDHWAEGFTAAKGEAFQGRHRPCMLFVFDEAEGLDPRYWETTDTMFQPGGQHGWLAIGNPVTTASQSAVEDRARDLRGRPKWRLFELSALNHPNIAAQLAGGPPLYPDAVTLAQVEQWFGEWADRIDPEDRLPTDVEWPPGSGVWYRPSPSLMGRVLGRRPLDGVNTVWGMAAWNNAVSPRYTPEWCWLHRCGLTVGCDVATYGDDNSVVHVRSGPLSLHHESRNGWAPSRLADRIKELCVQWTAWYNAHDNGAGRPPLLASQVGVVVELDGPGFAVLDNCKGFGAWSGLKVAEASDALDALGTEKYANKRSEIWHTAAEKARKGEMDLSRLPQAVLERLREQLLTPAYELLPGGTIRVEPKDDIKERLKRSPDDADGLLVAYSDTKTWLPQVLFKQE